MIIIVEQYALSLIGLLISSFSSMFLIAPYAMYDEKPLGYYSNYRIFVAMFLVCGIVLIIDGFRDKISGCNIWGVPCIIFGFVLTAAMAFGGIRAQGMYKEALVKDSTYELAETIDIKSLETVSDVSGSFVLGNGTVKNETNYYFYKKNEDGGFSLENIETSISSIYEDVKDNQTPYIEVYENLLKSKKKYKIHVPKGTVIEEYNAIVNK